MAGLRPSRRLFTVVNATTGAREVWAGAYDGFVYALNRSSGSTEQINGAVSHITDCGEPGVQKSLRYGFFYFSTEDTGTVQITTSVRLWRGGRAGVHRQPGAGSHALGHCATWDEQIWDTGELSTGIIRLDLSGLGEVVETTVQNLEPNQPFTLLGYEYMFRDRRHIRRPRSF